MRCRECGGPLSEARAALGLTLCSGRCHAVARGPSQACGTRPDHLWQITGGEGWRCLYCSRITDDAALVRAGQAIVHLGEARTCRVCRMQMRSGTLAVMLPAGSVEHANAATCRRRAAQRIARFGS